MLEHRDEQVAQRSVVLAPVRDVLPVGEAAPSDKNRQVDRRVRVRIAQIAAEQDRRLVDERAVRVGPLGELGHQRVEGLDDLNFDLLQLRDLGLVLPVV